MSSVHTVRAVLEIRDGEDETLIAHAPLRISFRFEAGSPATFTDPAEPEEFALIEVHRQAGQWMLVAPEWMPWARRWMKLNPGKLLDAIRADEDEAADCRAARIAEDARENRI